MTDPPKIVHDRLRAAELKQATSAGPAAKSMHPDANLLTAFAEQALSATERDGVLEHLALCADCREVVTVAQPAEMVGVNPSTAETQNDTLEALVSRAAKPASHKLFAWSGLRWAALAACVAVAGSVLLLRPGKLNQSAGSPQIASTAAPASAAGSPSVASAPSDALSNRDHQAVIAKGNDVPPKAIIPSARGALPQTLKAQQILTPGRNESPMLLARNKKSSGQEDKVRGMPGSAALALDNSSSRQTTETVEVSAAAGEVSQASADTTSMSLDEAPAIEKAKPAMQAASQGAGLPGSDADQPQGSNTVTPSTSARARSAAKMAFSTNPAAPPAITQYGLAQHNSVWAISGGVLQRSQDSGQTWQESLHPDRLLLCYASYSDEIWTGGQGGALYHSTDDGLTWAQVHPVVNNHPLTSDVNHIDLPRHDLSNPTQIVVFTANKEIWTSHDGGKTWETK